MVIMKLSAAILTAITLLMLQPGHAGAQSDTCGTDQPAISESITTDAGTYTVYVKMSLPGQESDVTAYSVVDSCKIIGSVHANGNTWSKLGGIAITAGAGTSFELDGESLGANDAAAKPQLLLVPAVAPLPCTPAVTCDTNIEGNKAYLNPVSLTTSSSGLQVQKITSPSTDTIKEVQYYTDGQLMYTTKALEPFNLAYADYFQQKIARVIVYNSKQRAVLQDTVPVGYTDTVQNAAFRIILRHSTLLTVIGFGLLLALLIIIARAIARHYEELSYFNYAHGLGRRELTLFQANFKAIVRNPTFTLISTGVITLILISTTIVLTNVFVVAPYRVDGTSMYATLQDKQLMAINKLPVTLNHQFKPTRGQVIVFHPNYGNLAYSDLRVDNILVKRIVGLPGERVVSHAGKLTIYNAENPNGYNIESTEPWGPKVTLQPADEPFDIQLANDQVFVAGDNRPHSVDSRINGALPLSEVIGVVVGY